MNESSPRDLRYLVVSATSGLAKDLLANIRRHFGKHPVVIEMCESAARALYALTQDSYLCVIVEKDLPGMDGLGLIREIRRTDGGIGILLLASGEVPNLDATTHVVSLPILNWTEFGGKLEQYVPEELRVKLGIQRRDDRLLKMLMAYTEPLRQAASSERDGNAARLVLIPDFFETSASREKGRTEDLSRAVASAVNSPAPPSPLPLAAPTARRLWRGAAELSFLAALMVVSAYLWSLPPSTLFVAQSPGGELQTTTVWLVTAFTAIVAFGFIVGKGIERALSTSASKLKEAKA